MFEAWTPLFTRHPNSDTFGHLVPNLWSQVSMGTEWVNWIDMNGARRGFVLRKSLCASWKGVNECLSLFSFSEKANALPWKPELHQQARSVHTNSSAFIYELLICAIWMAAHFWRRRCQTNALHYFYPINEMWKKKAHTLHLLLLENKHCGSFVSSGFAIIHWNMK